MRRNEQIRARELRVIRAPKGNSLVFWAVMKPLPWPRNTVLIWWKSPLRPIRRVCRVMDYGKFKYETQKKKQEAKKRQTVVQIKEIKVRPKTDDHDFRDQGPAYQAIP